MKQMCFRFLVFPRSSLRLCVPAPEIEYVSILPTKRPRYSHARFATSVALVARCRLCRSRRRAAGRAHCAQFALASAGFGVRGHHSNRAVAGAAGSFAADFRNGHRRRAGRTLAGCAGADCSRHLHRLDWRRCRCARGRARVGHDGKPEVASSRVSARRRRDYSGYSHRHGFVHWHHDNRCFCRRGRVGRTDSGRLARGR